VAAIVAVAPSVAERATSLPFGSLGLLLVAVMITGWLAALAAVRVATSTTIVESLKSE
jgi:cytochrome b561